MQDEKCHFIAHCWSTSVFCVTDSEILLFSNAVNIGLTPRLRFKFNFKEFEKITQNMVNKKKHNMPINFIMIYPYWVA